jgi:hypothetical protein
MPKSTTLNLPQNIITINQVIVAATSFTATNPGTNPTNTVLVTTANANDSAIKSLTICSDDTSPRTVQFWRSPDGGTTKYLIGTVVVAALAGTATLINVDVLGNSIITGLELDETGKPVLRLQGSGTPEQIYAGVITAAVTAFKTIWITGTQLDY